MDIFEMISKVISRQVANISKIVTRLAKVASKPFKLISTFVREQVKSLFRKPASQKDYVRFWGLYISKRFLAISFSAAVVVTVVFTSYVYPWLEGRLWTPTIALNSTKLANYSGPARVVNNVGVLVYRGDVNNGKLTGSGYQYDTKSTLVYVGAFKDAAYNGYGSLYADGILCYSGNFLDNLYEGTGMLYSKQGILTYQGSFSKGMREGTGIAYEGDGKTIRYRGSFSADLYNGTGSFYEKGTLVYTGNFTNGLYEGLGILYDSKGNVVYQGAFSKGSRQGEGTVYDSIGSALYTGVFLSDSVNYVSYLGMAPENITAAFGNPGYTVAIGNKKVLTYLNLGTSFICTDLAGSGTFACDKIVVNIEQGFLHLTRESKKKEIEQLLGKVFSSLTIPLSEDRKLAFGQLSIPSGDGVLTDKYLMSTYYIKLYYDSSGEFLTAMECGSY